MSDPFEGFKSRQRFYASLGGERKEDIDNFVRAMTALCLGFGIGKTLNITDETPSDMDGIVLKITIT